jgi:hypothetical protein
MRKSSTQKIIRQSEADIELARLLELADPNKIQTFTFSELVTFFTLTEYNSGEEGPPISLLEKYIQEEDLVPKQNYQSRQNLKLILDEFKQLEGSIGASDDRADSSELLDEIKKDED